MVAPFKEMLHALLHNKNSMSTPRLIDIHSHINFNAFKEDANAVIERTLKGGVWTILVGSQIDTSRRAVQYAETYPEGIYAAIGLHPIHLADTYVDANEIDTGKEVPGFKTRMERFDHAAYKELAEHSKTVAIGECGLDYFRVPGGEETKQLQAETFRKHIALAREVKKPLMIHCRNAYEDLLQILREEKAEEIGGDVHFFAGSWDIAKQFLDLGFYLSFTGVLTFTRDYDKVVKNMPLDRIMVETDAPYVTPVPHRGTRNEPLYVEFTARRIAEIKNIEPNKMAEQLTANARHYLETRFPSSIMKK
jgi:TatD DNase family protein